MTETGTVPSTLEAIRLPNPLGKLDMGCPPLIRSAKMCIRDRSGTDKHDHQIAAGDKRPLPASAKRNVKVVLEPAGERYMPSAPELSHGPGQIWIIKVLRQLKAQHFTKAHRHIGITGKIKINLQCIDVYKRQVQFGS